MSLEQAVKENTQALRELIAALKAQGGAPAVPTPAATQSSQPAGSATAPASTEPLKYEDIQKPFLKLVNKDRPAAVALLESLGVKKLDGVKPEQYANVLEQIEEKLNA